MGIIEKENNISFKCIEITQPIGSFYIGVIDYDKLIKISFKDIRRIEERDVEKYLGIQRPLSPQRVKELQKYVNFVDATFPTSVILAIEPENAEYIKEENIMVIKDEENVAKIIDGQHRIAGLEAFDAKDRKIFQINVTIFINMDMEDQAMVFSTINLNQTKVNKSLSFDLYEYAKSRIPQKTCHNIAKLLNTKEKSPFNNKIMILGKATGKVTETLTQATFVSRLLGYISKDPNVDRDDLKRGKSLRIIEGESNRFFFRKFVREGKDENIAKVLWSYFGAVSDRWPKAWKENIEGLILNRTTGFGALMRFLRPSYLHIGKKLAKIDLPSKGDFLEIFKTIKLDDDEFNSTRFIPGSAGESDLLKELKDMSGINLD